jgi:hypothetical protein
MNFGLKQKLYIFKFCTTFKFKVFLISIQNIEKILFQTGPPFLLSSPSFLSSLPCFSPPPSRDRRPPGRRWLTGARSQGPCPTGPRPLAIPLPRSRAHPAPARHAPRESSPPRRVKPTRGCASRHGSCSSPRPTACHAIRPRRRQDIFLPTRHATCLPMPAGRSMTPPRPHASPAPLHAAPAPNAERLAAPLPPPFPSRAYKRPARAPALAPSSPDGHNCRRRALRPPTTTLRPPFAPINP